MNEDEVVEILLVEDNLRDAELTIRALKKNNLANRVVHTEDGAEALDLLFGRGKYEQSTAPPPAGDARAVPPVEDPAALGGSPVNEGRPINAVPKVILLDLKLPKVSGLEVLRVIKSDPRLHTIPVVLVTSSAEDPDMQAAYKLGANSYVIKPVQFYDFMEAMSKLGMYWLMINHPLK